MGARVEACAVLLTLAVACTGSHGHGPTDDESSGSGAVDRGVAGDSGSIGSANSAGSSASAGRSGSAGRAAGGSAGSAGEGFSGAGGFARPPTAEDPWGGAPNVAPGYPSCVGGAFRGGGRRTAHCEGRCIHLLTVETSQPSDGAICREIDVRLVTLNNAGPVRTIVGKLPLAAWSRIFAIAKDVGEAKVAWANGACAGCSADRDNLWVTRDQLIERGAAEFHYPEGAAPASMKSADALVQALIDEMSTCTDPGAKPVMVSNCREETERCWFAFDNPADGHVSAGYISPMSSNGPCSDLEWNLCQSDLLPLSNTCREDVNAKLDKFCDGRPLPSALSSFAAELGLTVYFGAVCTSMQAQ